MAHLIDNEFAHYYLTDEEERQGAILSMGQRFVLQNILAERAEGRLALAFDSEKPNEFMYAEAHLKGQIEVLQYILAASDAAVAANEQEGLASLGLQNQS